MELFKWVIVENGNCGIEIVFEVFEAGNCGKWKIGEMEHAENGKFGKWKV